MLTPHNIPHPLLTLHGLVDQAHSSLQHALTQVPQNDIIHHTKWTALEQTRPLIASRLARPVPDPEAEVPPFVCGFCLFSTTLSSALQRHLTLFHSRPGLADCQIDFAKDTENGMPVCKHCRKVFRTWEGFSMHRRFNVCNILSLSQPDRSDQRVHDFIAQDPDSGSMADSTPHADLYLHELKPLLLKLNMIVSCVIDRFVIL